MDVATCLDLSLPEQMEAKFLALKALHAKKTKQLMQSIEAKEKDIAKLKVLSKDSRRTQMIQALRDKIRSMELVMDVIKAELGKSEHPSRGKMSTEQVNEFVIEKTVGGPKRFRPLTREELENKIATLEKSLLARQAAKGASLETKSVAGSRAPSVAGSAAPSRAGSRSARSEAKEADDDDEDGERERENEPASGGGRGGGGGGGGGGAVAAPSARDTARIVQLMEEVEGLRLALDVAEGAVELQKEEASRLRERNAELVSGEEEADFATRQYRELRAAYDALQEDLDASTRRLTEALEDNMALRGETDVVSEQRAMELDALHDQCERLLGQNSELLARLGEMELELEAAFTEKQRAGSASASAEAGEQAKAASLAAAERKAAKLREQLRAAEGRISELTAEAAQAASLTDQLREKNGLIRELTRRLEAGGSQSPERGAGVGAGGMRGRTGSLERLEGGAAGGASVGGQSLGSGSPSKGEAEAAASRLRAQLAEAREENRQLKQALKAAALNGPGSPAKSGQQADPFYAQLVQQQSAVLATLIDHVAAGGSASTSSRHLLPLVAATEKLLKLMGAGPDGGPGAAEAARTLVDADKLQVLLTAVDHGTESKS